MPVRGSDRARSKDLAEPSQPDDEQRDADATTACVSRPTTRIGRDSVLKGRRREQALGDLEADEPGALQRDEPDGHARERRMRAIVAGAGSRTRSP